MSLAAEDFSFASRYPKSASGLVQEQNLILPEGEQVHQTRSLGGEVRTLEGNC
jgi:hypothetical protein